jgi:hypothetical protein
MTHQIFNAIVSAFDSKREISKKIFQNKMNDKESFVSQTVSYAGITGMCLLLLGKLTDGSGFIALSKPLGSIQSYKIFIAQSDQGMTQF